MHRLNIKASYDPEKLCHTCIRVPNVSFYAENIILPCFVNNSTARQNTNTNHRLMLHTLHTRNMFTEYTRVECAGGSFKINGLLLICKYSMIIRR